MANYKSIRFSKDDLGEGKQSKINTTDILKPSGKLEENTGNIGFVNPIRISEQREKLERPINERKLESTKKKFNFKELIVNLILLIKKTPTFFVEEMPLSLQSLYFGILGTMLGFSFAILLFPESPGIFAVFFTTIFLSPIVYKQMNYNALMLGKTKIYSNNHLSMTEFKVKSNFKFYLKDFYAENKSILTSYFFFFLGILLVITCLIAVIPTDCSEVLFVKQGWQAGLFPSKDIGFGSVDKLAVFGEILKNNVSVIFVCFIVALIFPAGATLMIVWNAIYWGVVFSQYALFYSQTYTVSLASILIPLLLSVLPHTLIEIVCYFIAAISGNLIALGLEKEKNDSDSLYSVLVYSLILLGLALLFVIVGAFFETFIFDYIKSFVFGIFKVG
ncbi:MAG: stage II sporulation protein M [archaeon]